MERFFSISSQIFKIKLILILIALIKFRTIIIQVNQNPSPYLIFAFISLVLESNNPINMSYKLCLLNLMKDEQLDSLDKQQKKKTTRSTSLSKYFNSNRFPVKTAFNKLLITKKLKTRFDTEESETKKTHQIDLNEVSTKIKQIHRHRNNYTNKGFYKRCKNLQRSPRKQPVQLIPELLVEKQPLRFFKQFIQLSKKQHSSIIIYRKKSKNQQSFGPVSKSMVLNPNPHSEQKKTSPNLLTEIHFDQRYQKKTIIRSLRNRCKTNMFRQNLSINLSPKRQKIKIKKQQSFRSDEKFGGWDVRYLSRQFEQPSIAYH